MNRNIAATLVALAAAAAGHAFAESPLAGGELPAVGGKTRSEVQAELQAYKQAGVNPWSTSYNPLREFRGAASREQVVADYIAARDQVHALTGEDSGSAWLAQGGGSHGDSTRLLAGQPRSAQ
jgi:hypothetical protein